MAQTPSRKSHRPATLADVGREAGVSAMAVSAVLNGARTSARTAPETRQRILAAAERLQYRPNAAARALADRRMNTIGVAAVFQGNELNQYFLEVFNGVLEGAALHQQNTTVLTLQDWEKDADRLAGFCDGRIDGMILLAPVFTKQTVGKLPDHTPCVGVHSNLPLPRSFNLESDEEAGALEVVRYLVSLGHRRILHLSGPKGLTGAERRIRGFRRGLGAEGIRSDARWIVEAGYTAPGGREALREWMRSEAGGVMPQAIFCANDGVATGCLEVLAEAGLRVPHDLSVVGFDDTLAARSTVPQLTTVRQPLKAIGRRAADVLLERILALREGSVERTARNIIFPTELVLRGTTGRPPAADVRVPSL